MCVPVLMPATFASMMTALLGSVTRPEMEPFVDCARRTAEYKDKNMSVRKGTKRMFKTYRVWKHEARKYFMFPRLARPERIEGGDIRLG